MHITEYISRNSTTPLISIEIIPPSKNGTWHDLENAVSSLQKYGLSFTSVTSHAHERSIEIHDGEPVVRTKKKRFDTHSICIALKFKLGIEVMPHVICNGFTKDETEDALLNLHFLGVENVLALTGDSVPGKLPFSINQEKNERASILVEQINNMNHGVYLDPSANSLRTNFCIGVAGYPEKHHAAANFETDLLYLKEKVDKGAHFIITQMFFDNEQYYRFVEAARAIGITVPILPGLKPIYKKSHLTRLSEVFHVSIPKKLYEAAEKYTRDEEFAKAGIEHTRAQAVELIKEKAPGIHFFTMGSADPTEDILKNMPLIVPI